MEIHWLNLRFDAAEPCYWAWHTQTHLSSRGIGSIIYCSWLGPYLQTGSYCPYYCLVNTFPLSVLGCWENGPSPRALTTAKCSGFQQHLTQFQGYTGLPAYSVLTEESKEKKKSYLNTDRVLASTIIQSHPCLFLPTPSFILIYPPSEEQFRNVAAVYDMSNSFQVETLILLINLYRLNIILKTTQSLAD